MDDLVQQAMAKWPNVPDCYGWLGLDARGDWYMRDDSVQALGPFAKSKGSRLVHEKLIAFIGRNYASDKQGQWFFQNGPQRVYVDLEATPFIARTDHDGRLLLHDGSALQTINKVWMTEQGQLIVQDASHVAMVDDRDMAQCLSFLRWHGQAVTDEQLLNSMSAPDHDLQWRDGEAAVPIETILWTELESKLGFTARPRQAG